jgi:long-chain acyl-CoA synthetase
MKPANQMLMSYVATKNAKYYPNKTFLKDDLRQVTFLEFDRRTNALAGSLLARGLKKGERVVVINHNSIELLEVYFGVIKAGGIAVPVNIHLAGREWAEIFRNIKPKFLIIGKEYLKRLEQVKASSRPWQSVFVIYGKDGDNLPDYESLIGGSSSDPVDSDAKNTDTAMIILTSGTTGKPKGVMLSHQNLLSDAWASVISKRLTPNDIALVTAPFYQAGAWGSMLANIFCGNTIIIQNGFDPARVLAAIEKERVTTLLFVPVMLIKLMQYPEINRFDLSSMKTVVYGSAPMPVTPLKAVMDRFGWEFMNACGATETGPAYIAVLDYEAHHLDGSPEMEKRLYSIGKEGINSEVRIFDDDDQELLPGEAGEIVVRGPAIMKGYWRKPKETAKAMRNGWYHTGDLGYIDQDGYIYIIDRKKDLIISGGFNVYPKEIENLLDKHPAVLEVAVIGIPHELWGETPLALVVLKPGAIAPSVEEFMAFLKDKIAGYKMPKGGIKIIDALPRNASGKVHKISLRERYGGSKGIQR